MISTNEFYAELTALLTLQKETVDQFRKLPLETLNRRLTSESWSILECLEHLNLYGDYYLPEIQQKIEAANTKPEPTFKSSWLGHYFTESMKPKKNLNKMKTFKDKDPKGSHLDKTTIDRFLEQQKLMLALLEASKNVSLNKVKVGITIAKWLKIRLGDVFMFNGYHIERHIKQALKVLNS